MKELPVFAIVCSGILVMLFLYFEENQGNRYEIVKVESKTADKAGEDYPQVWRLDKRTGTLSFCEHNPGLPLLLAEKGAGRIPVDYCTPVKEYDFPKGLGSMVLALPSVHDPAINGNHENK